MSQNPSVKLRDLLRPRWTGVIAVVVTILAAILFFESRTNILATSVGLLWASRDRFPCPGLTGDLTAVPLFTAMGERLDRSPPGSVVLLGDSTITSSPGGGHGELPADQTFHNRLKVELGGTDVMNFGLWSADWPVLSRQTALLRLIQHSSPVPRTWVILSNFPLPVGHLYPVIFAQLCHHATCDRVCRALCAEESESRSGGAWSLFRYLPTFAEPLAGVTSFIQTYVSAAPVTSRHVQSADTLGWRTLWGEKDVTPHYERATETYLSPERITRWKRDSRRTFPRAIELLRAGWQQGGLLQLWYKEWLRQLRGLKGQIIFLSQVPNPDYMADLTETDRSYMETIRTWIDQESQRVIPDSMIVPLRLHGSAYYDLVHWSPEGAAEAARLVAAKINSANADRTMGSESK